MGRKRLEQKDRIQDVKKDWAVLGSGGKKKVEKTGLGWAAAMRKQKSRIMTILDKMAGICS